MIDLSELHALAIEAARAPSQLILSGFRSPSLIIEHKPDGSPVTRFDKDAERTIRAFLAERQTEQWPVLGEEFGADPGEARYRWVVDPIDGTQAFARGLPTFGTLLAFEEVATGRALVGVVHLPAAGETYSGARGLGAWCNGERIHIAPPREMKDCVVSVPAARLIRLASDDDSRAHLNRITPRWRCFSDCAAHAMVARGSLDAHAEFGLCRWDIAATEVIVAEAGGVVLIRDSAEESGKYDSLFGEARAVRAVAGLFGFSPTT